MEELIDRTVDFSCHGVDYVLHLHSNADSVALELEDKVTGGHWKNQFSSQYLEEITQKTGNYKKFSVFVKMLNTAISRTNESVVFLDILTAQDLEVLKARKQTGNAGSRAAGQTGSMNNKRYLILTYVVEFDKVHYPLPLHFEETPDVEALKGTIKKLRGELEEARGLRKSGGASTFLTGMDVQGNSENQTATQQLISSLKTENDALKQKLKRIEENTLQRQGAVELDTLLKRKNELEKVTSELQLSHDKEVSRLQERIITLERELDSRGNEGEVDEMQSTTNSRKIISRQQREIDGLTKEVESLRGNDRRQKARIKQLEIELESALKRPGSRPSDRRSPYSGNRTGGFSPSSGNKGNRTNSVPSRNSSPGSGSRSRARSNDSTSSKGRNPNIFRKAGETPPKIVTKQPVPSAIGRGTYGYQRQPSPKDASAARKGLSPGRGPNSGMSVVGKNYAGPIKKPGYSATQNPKAGVGRYSAQPNKTTGLGTTDKKLTTKDILGSKRGDPVDGGDIDARLNKLQELLKMAKS